MPEGLIVKALSGYYYVLPKGQTPVTTPMIQCRARGIFKKKGISPLVGDRVIFEQTENGEGMVDEILPRTSELIRPPIANVDLVVLVFSVNEPELNLQLLDKFLVHTEQAGLETIICLSKQDLLLDSTVATEILTKKDHLNMDQVIRLYNQIGYDVILSSAITKEGTNWILDKLSERIAVFSGQSGVGKSSLLNAMIPGLHLETNPISFRLGRGKHTTRHVELISLSMDGWVADTPGFSQLDFSQVNSEQLDRLFIEFIPFISQCKYRGCMHLHEPGCRVIEAKEQGEIASSRYEHYLLFLEELKEKKRRY